MRHHFFHVNSAPFPSNCSVASHYCPVLALNMHLSPCCPCGCSWCSSASPGVVTAALAGDTAMDSAGVKLLQPSLHWELVQGEGDVQELSKIMNSHRFILRNAEVWYVQVNADRRWGRNSQLSFFPGWAYIWNQGWRCTLFIMPLLLF